jgi:hypothetical protein
MQDYILLIGCTQSFFQSLTWALSQADATVHSLAWPLQISDDAFLKDLLPFCVIVDLEQWQKSTEEEQRFFQSYYPVGSKTKVFLVSKVLCETHLPYDQLIVPLPVLELRETILKCR